MHDAQDIATRDLAWWNARDPARRRALLAAPGTPAATCRDPMASAEGDDGIAGLIEGVQARSPGFRFARAGRAEAVGDAIRFAWTYGPAGTAAPLAGTGFALLEAGRLAASTRSLDRTPDAA